MCGSVFWGFLIILFGVSILINAIFGINIPLVKIFFAGCLIYWGVSLLLPERKQSCALFFKSSVVNSDFDQEKYRVCFGSSTIDLDSLQGLTDPKTVKISAQFADVIVLLPQGVPVRVKANVAFANVDLPGKMRNSEYVNLYGAAEPLLTVLIDGAFARVVVKE